MSRNIHSAKLLVSDSDFTGGSKQSYIQLSFEEGCHPVDSGFKSGLVINLPRKNNCFSTITQVIIREKQERYEKCQFCLFLSNCHLSVNRDAQSADHMLNR